MRSKITEIPGKDYGDEYQTYRDFLITVTINHSSELL
jgi:hypothetical protein